VIIGSGLDLTPVGWIVRESARRGGDAFEDLFTPAELAWCRAGRQPARAYAAAFAAKEACVKALGTGLVGSMTWRDMELVPAAAGAAHWRLRLVGATAAAAAARGVTGLHVAVTLSRTDAIAWVVLVGT
jgi:holo-[acyl-carrier protein] synthase